MVEDCIHLYLTRAYMYASRDECCSWGQVSVSVDGVRLKVEDGRS